MADIKKYLSLERLAEYDALLKAKMATDDASTLESAKEYADELVDGVNTAITSGNVVVKEAEHATSADSAAKATQDANGNVIVDTYETKVDAETKLAEAKEYVDTKIDSHTHSWNNLTDKPFGEEHFAETFLNNVTIETAKNYSYIYGEIDPELEFTMNVGQTYKVIFNGVEYECVAFSWDGDPVIGNGAIVGQDANASNEPFLFGDFTSWEGGMSLYTAEAGTYTLSIGSEWTETRRLDPKYISTHGTMPGNEKIFECTTEDCDWTLLTYGNFEIGMEYNVVWDGVEYNNLVCYDYEGYPTIGANYDDIYGGDTAFPFSIFSDPEYLEIYASSLEDAAHTIKVSRAIIIRQLDEIYIPDTIARMKDLENLEIDLGWSDIAERPFYDTTGEDKLIFDEDVEMHLWYTEGVYHGANAFEAKRNPLKVGNVYNVIINGTAFNGLICYLSPLNQCHIGTLKEDLKYLTAPYPFGTGSEFYDYVTPTQASVGLRINRNLLPFEGDTVHLSIYEVGRLCQIEDKFIPDSIARVEDLANIDLTPYETKVDAETKLADAKAYADERFEELGSYVGTIPSTSSATNIVAYVQEKTSGIATEGAMTELGNRVTAVEGDVSTIKGDYLKAADKQDVVDAVAAEKERAEIAEAGLQTQLNTIMNNPDTEGVINSINEFTEYINDHGEIADGFRTDINANKKAIEDHMATDHDFATADATLKAELNGEIAKKADKTTVEGIDGRVTTAEGKITTVEGKVSTLEGQMTTVQGAVATKAEAQALTDAVSALEGADTAIKGRLDAIETQLGTGEGSVSDQIADAKQEAIDAAAADATSKANAAESAAKGHADSMNTAMNARVEALEAIDHNHSNKAELDLIASGDKAKWDDAYAKRHEHSNLELLEGVTTAKIAAWDASEQNAKTHANGLNTAMDTRVTAIEDWHNNFVECTEEDINALFTTNA